MKKTTYLYTVSILLSATSCGETFYPEFDTKPVAVLNSMVQPDSVVTASVLHTFIVSTGKDGVKERTVKDADVILYINGSDCGRMDFDSKKNIFVSDVRAKRSDTVKIKASTSLYGVAEGVTQVPCDIDGTEWTYSLTTETDFNTTMISPDGTIYHPKAYCFHYSITFTDPSDTENYYMLMESETNEIECNDPILGENDTPLDAVYSKDSDFFVFSDKSISGQEYTLNFMFKRHSHDILLHDNKIINKVCLYSISKDYYLYLLSIYKKYNGLNGDLESLGLAEPKFIYSNVSPGVGIVAAQTPICHISHDVTDLIK